MHIIIYCLGINVLVPNLQVENLRGHKTNQGQYHHDHFLYKVFWKDLCSAYCYCSLKGNFNVKKLGCKGTQILFLLFTSVLGSLFIKSLALETKTRKKTFKGDS